MKLTRFVAGVALSAIMCAFALVAQAQPTPLQLLGAFAAEHPSSKAMEIFKAEAERQSGGTIKIELTTGVSALKALLDGVRTQSAFGGWIATGHMARLVPEMGALGLPYVFDSYDQAAHALSGPVGTIIDARLAAKGFTLLGWMTYGVQNVANAKRPLRTVDDFRGLKLRVLPDEIRLATFRALGANPVGMDLKDLYLALRQGDVDGLENGYSVIYNYKLYENVKYLSDTAHSLGMIVFVVNRKAFMDLPPEQQKAIRSAAASAVARQWQMTEAEDADSLVKLKEMGMQFDPLSPETRAALHQATAVVLEDARKQVGAELIDRILAARKPERWLPHDH
jgi:TRAP-type transport system periplasmic protein